MGIKMLMAMQQCVSAHPMPPPPPALAPKPDKDNARLQKILKRIAKQKAAEISLQPEDASDKSHSYLSKPFRACLSPVSEASPDPEHCDRRTPQYLQSPLPSLRPHSTILTQTRTTSLYPLRRTFYKGKIEILPKKGGQHIPAEVQNQDPGQLLQPVIPVKTFFVSNVQSSGKKQSPMVAMPPRFSPSFYARPDMEMPKANISTNDSIKPKDIVSEANITKLYASGPDTAMTSTKGYVFETSRVKNSTYEPPRAKTPTYEPPRVKTPTYEVTSVRTPTYELTTYEPPRARIPTYEPPRARTPTYEPPRARTPTYEPPRARTPIYEPPRARTPTYEPLRARTPTYEPPRARTPTYEPPRARTPTYEPPRARTSTYETPRARTPTFETPRVRTPTYDPLRVKTPTYDPPRERTPTYETPRVKTPTYNPPRARTPTYETLRAKTPTYEPQRVKTPRAQIPANELLRGKTFTRAVPQESLSTEGFDVSAIKNASSANMEIHQITKTTLEKPSNTGVETTNQEVKSFLKAAGQKKPVDNVKPPRSKISGWTRLKKHMVVEEEPPKFLEPEPELPESEEQKQNQSIVEDRKQESSKARATRANKMWDAMLFQMFAWKEHLTEENRQNQQESALDTSRQAHQTSWFSCRLPLLLFRPRFDARKLKEAAKGPLRRISSTLIESGLHRKAIDDEELKDFNQTAKGWQTKAVS
ncbi:neurofilament heavy polypeptide [Narcine bancroftii]|uniref:neurofilament heavy polypeptide n=1 Tax=Narcine bancroftii TaxID=1343680 RepID=UPI0038319AF1